MAACGSLQHIFENPLPENPTLLESLSLSPSPSPSPWTHLNNTPDHQHSSSFTEIFGELHFKETHIPHLHVNTTHYSFATSTSHKNCTEGLGFESSDEVDNSWAINTTSCSWTRLLEDGKETTSQNKKMANESPRRWSSAAKGGGFPPPLSSLSKTGKPQFCFKSYREDGRFVLKEIRVRTEEFLHACREDGRLKLHFVQPDYENLIPEEEDDEEDDDDGDIENVDNE